MNKLSSLIGLSLSILIAAAVAFAADGKELFSRCQGCHGPDGSKAAMGIGRPVKGMSEDEVYKILVGYKNGTYGGERKAMMQSQVKNLSDDDLKAIAKYSATL